MERKTLHKLISRIPSKTAPAVTRALQDIFTGYPDVQNIFKSITRQTMVRNSAIYNQGKELQIDVYFARPYGIMGARNE